MEGPFSCFETLHLHKSYKRDQTAPDSLGETASSSLLKALFVQRLLQYSNFYTLTSLEHRTSYHNPTGWTMVEAENSTEKPAVLIVGGLGE